MLHISELKVLLDNQNLDEFSKKVKEHFQGSNQDDVTSANKVINLVSFIQIYLYKVKACSTKNDTFRFQYIFITKNAPFKS